MLFQGHKSVLNKECMDFLISDDQSEEEKLYADMTFGGGGHSYQILKKSNQSRVIALDQDNDAYSNGLKGLKEFGYENRCKLIKDNYVNFPEKFKSEYQNLFENCNCLSGIIMDLGVSSHQFDRAERGFSFRNEGPLDMRMNQDDHNIETAMDIVSNYSNEELNKIFLEFGEERFSRRIAENIIEERRKKPITTTIELENIIFHSYPSKMRYGRTHPATKCFQALRIFVNKELEVLADVIPRLIPLLCSKGRLAIISFHSLEDRIVKHLFKELKVSGGVKILTKRPIIPSGDEIKFNSRSRSAKLRVLERL